MLQEPNIIESIEFTQTENFVTIRTYQMGKAIEKTIHDSISNILNQVNHPKLLPLLYTVVKELTINATKANQKRVFFEEKNLDIHNEVEYSKGVNEFKKSFSESMEEDYSHKTKQKGYYCQVSFQFDLNGMVIEIQNNTPIAPQEEVAIQEKLEKAMGYDDLAQFYIDNADNMEGAGIGLALIVIMLKGEGISPNYFKISSQNDITLAKLKIPFSEKFTDSKN